MIVKFTDKYDILQDIKTVIKKEGNDELRYELPRGHTLIIEVLAATNGNDLAIAVERLNEFGNTVECATDDYECSDDCLIAMIENALG